MAKGKFEIQPAVKKETGRVAVYSLAGTVIMWIAFAVLHYFVKEEIPFNYTVFLGGIAGALVAVLNFFLMCMTVQRVAAESDDENARLIMKNSYSKRMALQLVWLIVAIAAPCFQWAAGFIPLLFPSLGIKIKGIIEVKTYKGQEVEQKQDEYRS